jgi:hypothetical protein
MKTCSVGLIIVSLLMAIFSSIAICGPILSHPPLRILAHLEQRPMGAGPAYYADFTTGNDSNDGTQQSPWKTISHAVTQLIPGDTLYLREGIFFDNLYVALRGTENAPITIRSYPGERAVIDGCLPEFYTSPGQAWEPYAEGAGGEFRSVRRYPNLRDVVGAFGDSMIGLQTYGHAEDLRSSDERWIWNNETGGDLKPVYVGPGLWYNSETERIHIRLAHTNISDIADFPNYKGETDPRKLPLVIAPFKSIPLFVDGAANVRFQDLEIRGGGYDCVVLQGAKNLTFQSVLVRGGTTTLRSRSTGPVQVSNCGFYGNMPPWAFRSDSSQYVTPWTKPEDNVREVARLTAHALLVMEGHDESDLFWHPLNHDWEISFSEFADGHDGIYLNGDNMRFHHNWVDSFQDDSMYLSPLTPQASRNVYVYQNVFTKCLTAFGFGGNTRAGGSYYGLMDTGNVYVYRNIVDFREAINWSRATETQPAKLAPYSFPIATHGRQKGTNSSIFGPLFIYHNTIIAGRDKAVQFMHSMLAHTNAIEMGEHPRYVFNNIFTFLTTMPDVDLPAEWVTDFQLQTDGNLYWEVRRGVQQRQDYFQAFRSSSEFEQSKKRYAPGLEAGSLVADPRFVKFDSASSAQNDYRLQEGSPAIDAGVAIPESWDDPLRDSDRSRPDIGALPSGSEPLRVGIRGRIEAGAREPSE